MKDKKIVFMGTPNFSVPVLDALIKNYNVIAVVTQPDKEVGRKKVLTKSPVKLLAEENNIKVFEPKRLRDEYQDIIDLNPDMIVTCAYGQILPKELLEFPKYKTINVHASLLPKYRGGAPIHHAIINGEKTTGITIMRTDVGMDDGDIISKEEIDILDTDDYNSLSNKLSILGKDLLIKTLPDIFNEKVEYIKQNEEEVTYAYTIKREDEKLDFNKTTDEIYNKIRALSETGSYSILDNEEIKIYKARKGEKIGSINGQIICIYKDGIGVATKDGEIIITTIQVPGKKKMSTKDYLNGINKDSLIGKIFN